MQFSNCSGVMDYNTDNMTDSVRGLLNRARAFCAGSEQCRSAVHRKLTGWGATDDEAVVILEKLVEEGYIDERRYVRTYCESKLLRAGWGGVKVRFELLHKGIPRDIVDEGIAAIDVEGRDEAIRKVAAKKMDTLHGQDEAVVRRRLASYLAQRGFGMDEIGRVVAEMIKNDIN